MSIITFYKYHGAGNDFIMIDGRESLPLDLSDHSAISGLCDRHFGIGADGLIVLLPDPDHDFRMAYFNADGGEGSFCGNGGRCAVAFARHIGMTTDSSVRFAAYDGPHRARMPRADWVELEMRPVKDIKSGEGYYFVDTGSPHYLKIVSDLEGLDVEREGKAIRYSPEFREEGTNVNFIEMGLRDLSVRTYERGVEAETLACGTGVVASALVYHLLRPEEGAREVEVRARGGRLSVRFKFGPDGFSDIWLCGPAKRVFSGSTNINYGDQSR
ncbi:MAG: diaminopimelate epimerase [Saprospiraceae bacterium]|nr:diaminopimelate epimerase [Saprospiraceae bacterium]